MLGKRFIILTIVYTLLSLCAFFIYSFFFAEIPVILSRDVLSYKVALGVLHFTRWVPHIILSIAFVTMATFMDRDSGKSVSAFSSAQMQLFKKVFVICVASVIIVFLVTEIVKPQVNSSIDAKVARYEDYTWYVQESEKAFSNGDVFAAMFYIDQALTYDEESQEARELKEKFERAPAEMASRELNYFPELLSTEINTTQEPLTVLALLEKARLSFENKDYFDAHYYSFIGLELGGINNENSPELQKISLDSWEEISQWSGFETDEEMEIYAQKRKGYEALMAGDALSSYYIYLDLHNRIPYDKDVSRYFDVATQSLLNEYFFIDETTNLLQFEKNRNISFSVKRTDGLHYDIAIGGITNIRHAGNLLKYLRNYSCTILDPEGAVLYAFTVPYAKLIGQPIDAFSAETVTMLSLNEGDLVPRLQLTSVDRNTQGISTMPTFAMGSMDSFDERITLLPMSLDDFDLVVDASVGPQYVNLASLFSFIPKAEQFGFSAQLYSSFFLKRASYPFLVFALFMFLAIQAWNYKLVSGTLFRFYWILIVPFFTIIAKVIGVLIDYGMSLLALALGGIEGNVKIVVTILIFVVVIIMLSARFLSLHEKPDTK